MTVGGKIYKRRGLWWVKYYADGQEHRESVARLVGKPPHECTESDARQALDERRRQIYQDRFVEPRYKKLTVGECLQALVTNLTVRRVRSLGQLTELSARLERVIGAQRASEMTTSRVEAIAARWMADGQAPGTVHAKLRFVVQALKLAVEHNRLSRAPRMPRIKLDNARQGFVRPDQFAAVLAHLDGVDAAIVEWAWLTGWRKSEILTLAWERVDRVTGEIQLSRTKNGQRRVLPLEGRLVALIEQQWKARGLGVPYVFHRHGHKANETWVNLKFKRATVAAGLEGLVFHDLRRSAVRNMLRAGVLKDTAKRISGHTSDATFSRYNIVATDDVREGLRRVQGYLHQDNDRDNPMPDSANA